jgi:hypothetical protein
MRSTESVRAPSRDVVVLNPRNNFKKALRAALNQRFGVLGRRLKSVCQLNCRSLVHESLPQGFLTPRLQVSQGFVNDGGAMKILVNISMVLFAGSRGVGIASHFT